MVNLPQTYVTVAHFDYPIQVLWLTCLERLLYYSAFQAIGFERTGRKLFQKGFVCTKLVIYVFRITFSYLVYAFKVPLIIMIDYRL